MAKKPQYGDGNLNLLFKIADNTYDISQSGGGGGGGIGATGATGPAGIDGGVGATGETGATGASVDTSAFVQKSGDTMTGKLNLPASTTASAPVNIGSGVAPTAPVSGDLWVDGTTLSARVGGTTRPFAFTNGVNSFTRGQVVDVIENTIPALRVTQRGTGEALRVEDETTPDATAFVVSNSGRVGVGVTPDATVSLSVDTTGLKFGDGTIQTTAAFGVAGATGATGVSGVDGATGATGIAGIDGATGSTGATGEAGAEGSTGATGVAGVDGETGATGVAGVDGATGATGEAGATGVAGTDGATGLQGDAGATGATGPAGDVGATGVSPDTSAFVQKSGDTMTGKLVAAADTTSSKLNIGDAIAGSAPSSLSNGDVWINSNNRLSHRSGGVTYQSALTNGSNSFGSFQIIDVNSSSSALRVTQRGTGEALRVEDETTPDATAFVISNDGRVGIGVTPDATVSLSLDTTGLKFGDGTIQTTAAVGGGGDGATGATGSAGSDGATGATGDVGATGAAGLDGATGATGATGPAPEGTGIVSVVDGVLQSPQTVEELGALSTSNNSYIIAISGDNLIEKYAEAKVLTPRGQAKSETNRASLIIFPGEYSVSEELVIDTSFVDIIGLEAQVKKPSVTILNNTISVTANDVRVSGISVGNQQFKIADSKPLQYFENCSGGVSSFSSQNPYNFQASGTYVNCAGGDESFAGFRIASGIFINCSGGYASFGGDGGYASGVFENCVGGDYSFGGGYAANAIGKFTKCSGGTYSFGGQFGTANGTFTDCTGGEYSFAGEGGTASGTFNRCKGDFYSFGSYGVAIGSFANCSGESYSFAGEGGTASGTFLNCTGSYRSFGGAGTASGYFVNCITRQDESFGYFASGTFIGCIAGFYSFGTDGAATGIFRDCIGEQYCFGAGIGFEGTASGTFINCTGGNRSWEFCVCSGTFINCISGDESFKGVASGFFQGCRAGNSSFGTSGGVASGTFIDCIGGISSFGSATGGEASGVFKSCSGGNGSFGGLEMFSGSGTANGTFSECIGGDYSFGGEGGTANGVFENCSSGNYSFGSGEFSSGTLTGTLFNCRTSGEFIELSPPSSGKAIMVNCLDGNKDIIEAEAEAL
jgi:hypothetical protein